MFRAAEKGTFPQTGRVNPVARLKSIQFRVTSSVNRAWRILRLYGANGSAQAWGRLFLYAAKRLAGRPVPVFFDIALTYRCQCRCVHCSADSFRDEGRKESDTALFKEAIDQARRLGVLEVIFSGGEPLLREDIVELVRHAHRAGMIIRLNTNGLLLSDKLTAELKRAGLNQCGVSIDSADPGVHDGLRRQPGLSGRVDEGILNLKRHGIRFQVLTYASKANVDSGLKSIIERGRRLGALGVFIFFPVAVGRWNLAFDRVLSEEESEKVRRLQDLTFVHLELPTRRTNCCAYDKLVLYMTPYGEVTPCPFVPFAYGNLRDNTLEELWERFTARLDLKSPGFCPMNKERTREEFKRHIEGVRVTGIFRLPSRRISI